MSVAPRYSSSLPSLRYVDHGGHRPTLLLLHGVTRCGGDWEPLLPALSDDWRVITIDQRGHGDSERADSYLVTDYISDVVQFVRDDIAMPMTILGHSLGAMVAAGVAAELPQLVRGLVLEDPPFHTMGNRIADSAWHAQFLGMRAAARRGGTVDELIDALADIRLPATGGGFKRLGDLRDRSSLAWSAACLRQLDPELLTPVIEGRWLDGYDVVPTLSRIPCPALLLQGDPAVGGALTDADAATAQAAMSSCQLLRFSGCGHQLHRDRPAELLQAMQDFFSPCQNSNNAPPRAPCP